MNKKQNTILFIIIGTAVEVLISIILIIALFIASVYFTKNDQSKLQILIPVSVVCGVLGGMIIYQNLARWVINRFKMEDKLDPLLPQRFRKRNRKD